MEQQYSLRWNNYLNQITNAFDALKNEEDLVDVTLSCEGRKIKAHKILLSACSPYFRDIFKENPCQHPVIVFRDFKHVDLQAIIDFMYKGEVDVKQDSFESFLRAAELLQVKGLTDGCKENSSCEREDCDLSKIIESDSEIPTDDLATPLAVSRPKKRKNSKTTEKEKPLDKKQKSALTDKAFIPKQEFIEDLTFEKRVSESSNTDQSELLPKYCESKKEIRPLPKGPGTSLELSSDMLMQTDESNSTATGNKVVTVEDSEPNENIASNNMVGEPKSTMIVAQSKQATTVRKNDLDKSSTVTKPVVEKLISTKPLQLPDGLVVTVKNERFNEVQTIVRSNDANTPILDLTINQDQNTNMGGNMQSHVLEEPKAAEEAPQITSDELLNEVPQDDEEEELEPEFDYFGCEICKADAKPVDKFNVVLSHKCPICPHACFCAHLLKEHMKVIHGWFNVQRRFTHF